MKRADKEEEICFKNKTKNTYVLYMKQKSDKLVLPNHIEKAKRLTNY